MLQSVNSETLTNVKVSPNSLTTPTKVLPTSHLTLTQLSLAGFQKLFVPLRTIRSNSHDLIVLSSYEETTLIFLNRYYFGSSPR